MFTVTYPEGLTYVGATSGTAANLFTSVHHDETNRIVTVTYAKKGDALAATDTIVSLQFEQICDDMALTVNTIERDTTYGISNETEAVTVTGIGHDYGEPTYTWTQVGNTVPPVFEVTASRTCAHDPDHIDTETATVDNGKLTVVGEDTNNDGVDDKWTFTATFTNTAFEEQQKVVTKEVAVTLTSSGDGTATAGNPIANVSGGGSYTIGDTATLVAPTVAGFTFKGWYPVGGDITTDRLSAAQTFEYTVRADNNLIAVYEADSGAKFRLTITGTRFTIKQNATDEVTTQRGRFDEDYEASSSITVTYTGSDNFLYWINSNKMIVSTDRAYSFTLVKNMDIDAVYSDSDDTVQEALVLFVHSRTYGQVISQRYYNLNETIIYPVAPVKAGKTFTGWDKTEEQIKDLIRTGETRIPVYPNYASNGEQYTITLEYWVNNVKQDEEQYAVDVGSTKVLTVGSKYNLNGEDFSYWTDAEGHILGYNNEKYVVWQTGDYTVRAVYNGATEKLPIVRMTNAFATQNGEDCYINFTSVRSIPDGYTVEKSGILYASINRIPLANAKDQMTIWYKENGENGAYVNEFPLESKELEEASTIYFFVPQAIQGTQIIGRAYVVIKNITTGEITYLYSDNIIYASYNELVNKQFHNQELNALN